jgi:hypothetical protein
MLSDDSAGEFDNQDGNCVNALRACREGSKSKASPNEKKWQALGRYVCRHGVFFNAHQRCSCLAPGSSSVDDWAAAKWMPPLDPDLKAMTISPFALENFERLGILQARLRRYDW